MAHNLMDNGKRMMFYGEKPWHGLGTELKNPAKAREAIEAARLDYKVEIQPVYLKNGNEIAQAKATVANGKTLGVVGNGYRVIQNVEAFNFFDVVVGEGNAYYETCGALGQGERIWILAKVPGDIIVRKDDKIEKYLILTNSHDGKSSLRLYLSPVRVVCSNTLTASMHNAENNICIRHTGNVQDKVEEARRVLGITINYYKQFEQIVKSMANVQMSKATAENYFNTLLKVDGDKEDESAAQTINKRNELLGLFENGMGNDQPGIKHTVYAAYNAATELIDHHRTVKGANADPTKKLSSIWFGSGADFKARAFDEALVYVGVRK